MLYLRTFQSTSLILLVFFVLSYPPADSSFLVSKLVYDPATVGCAQRPWTWHCEQFLGLYWAINSKQLFVHCQKKFTVEFVGRSITSIRETMRWTWTYLLALKVACSTTRSLSCCGSYSSRSSTLYVLSS